MLKMLVLKMQESSECMCCVVKIKQKTERLVDEFSYS